MNSARTLLFPVCIGGWCVYKMMVMVVASGGGNGKVKGKGDGGIVTVCDAYKKILG